MLFTYIHDINWKQRPYEREILNEHKIMLLRDNKQKMFIASIIIFLKYYFPPSLKHCNLQKLDASISDEITSQKT
jgi:hypothetical protein